MIPRTIGERYAIVGVVSQGTASSGIKARDHVLGRDVFVRLSNEWHTDDAEKPGVSDLNLAHTVRVYSFVDDPYGSAVVSEWVDGPSLAALARARRLDLPGALAALDGVLAGLEQIHALGMTHGYLTPTRVLVDASGTSKITDIGIPPSEGSDWVRFLAPELDSTSNSSSDFDLDSPTVTPASDVYGAGKLLEFALAATGADAETGDHKTLRRELAGLVDAATKAAPSERVDSVAALRVQLTDLADHHLGGWASVGVASLVVAAGAVGSAAVISPSLVGTGAATSATVGALGAGGSAAVGLAGTSAAVGQAAATASTAGLLSSLAAQPVAVAVGATAVSASLFVGGVLATGQVNEPPALPPTVSATTIAEPPRTDEVPANQQGGEPRDPMPNAQPSLAFSNAVIYSLGGDAENPTWQPSIDAPTGVVSYAISSSAELHSVNQGGALQDDSAAPTTSDPAQFWERECAIDGDGQGSCAGFGAPALFGQQEGYRHDWVPMPAITASNRPLSDYRLVHVTLAAQHTCVLAQSGEVLCWHGVEPGHAVVGGGSASDLLGADTGVEAGTVVQVGAGTDLADATFVDVEADERGTCALRDTGQIYCWGIQPRQSSGPRLHSTPAALQSQRPMTSMAVGPGEVCGVDDTGSVYCVSWASFDDGSATGFDGAESGVGAARTLELGVATRGEFDDGSGHTMCVLQLEGAVVCQNLRRVSDATPGTWQVVPELAGSEVIALRQLPSGTGDAGQGAAEICGATGAVATCLPTDGDAATITTMPSRVLQLGLTSALRSAVLAPGATEQSPTTTTSPTPTTLPTPMPSRTPTLTLPSPTQTPTPTVTQTSPIAEPEQIGFPSGNTYWRASNGVPVVAYRSGAELCFFAWNGFDTLPQFVGGVDGDSADSFQWQGESIVRQPGSGQSNVQTHTLAFTAEEQGSWSVRPVESPRTEDIDFVDSVWIPRSSQQAVDDFAAIMDLSAEGTESLIAPTMTQCADPRLSSPDGRLGGGRDGNLEGG